MMRSHKARIGLAALAALAMGLAGCESAPVRQTSAEPTYQEASMSQFIAANYRAADALAAPAAPGVAANNFRSSGTMLVATIADINALEQSTPLGRLITEHLSSRLSQTGNAVVEMKLRSNVFVRNDQGEFLLTREFKELARSHNASAVVVGTYTDGGTFVFVSLKLIDPASGIIQSAHDYALPLDRQVRRLISRQR